MTQSKRRPPLSPERVLQRDLMDVFMGFPVRRSRMPKLEHDELVASVVPVELVVVPKLEHHGAPKVVEPAMKLVGPTDKPQEAVAPPVSVAQAPKVERVQVPEPETRARLAQAPQTPAPGVPLRGRGAGRQFTKVTAARAAVARAQCLSPERRREIALAAAAARWGKARTP